MAGATGATGGEAPGVTRVGVDGTAVMAQCNMGYLANGASELALTLSAAPAIGDVVRVVGISTGGWK